MIKYLTPSVLLLAASTLSWANCSVSQVNQSTASCLINQSNQAYCSQYQKNLNNGGSSCGSNHATRSTQSLQSFTQPRQAAPTPQESSPPAAQSKPPAQPNNSGIRWF